MRKPPTMIGLDTNLARVVVDKEDRLKMKHGKAYRPPLQRMHDEANPLMPKDNEFLADLECILG